MPRQLWLVDAAKRAGLEVAECAGWRERGSDSFNPNGIVCHHTGGANTGDMPSLRVLLEGRSDLSGPLCNYGLSRSGKVYVVAAGRANHAGRGGWQGMVGNSSVVGIEAENNGGQPWPEAQLDAYTRLCAAITRKLSGSPQFCCSHKEWASPPGRKVDPHSINMNSFRTAIADHLRSNPTPQPAPPTAGDDFARKVRTMLPTLTEGAGAGERANQAHYVKILQALLVVAARDLVADANRFIDGQMSNVTVGVLRTWQGRTGKLAADGVCGPATWAWLVGV